MLQIKPGVRVHGLRPEALLAVVIAHSVFADHDLNAVITSVVEGKHSVDSLHYTGMAVDFRTRHVVPSALAEILASLKEALGEDYDVLAEDTHIHIEYQPKAGVNF